MAAWHIFFPASLHGTQEPPVALVLSSAVAAGDHPSLKSAVVASGAHVVSIICKNLKRYMIYVRK